MTETIRLWDHGFKFLAIEQIEDDRVRQLDELIGITIRGDGPIHKAARAYLDHEAWDRNLYVTIDPEQTRLTDFQRRRGGIITEVSISDHTCECGNPVVTTQITAATSIPKLKWPAYETDNGLEPPPPPIHIEHDPEPPTIWDLLFGAATWRNYVDGNWR